MTMEREIRIYWTTVDLCLESFFGKTPSQARMLVEKTKLVLDEMTTSDHLKALPYHEEPVNMAASLAESRFGWTPALNARYVALRTRAKTLASREISVAERLPNKAEQPRRAALLQARG